MNCEDDDPRDDGSAIAGLLYVLAAYAIIALAGAAIFILWVLM